MLIFKIVKEIVRPIKERLRNILNYSSYLYKYRNLKLGSNVIIKDSLLGNRNALGNNVRLVKSSIEDYSYIGNNSVIRQSTIGKFTCIGSDVKIGLGTHPTKNFVSIHPVFFSSQKQIGISFVNENLFDEYPIKVEIGNDVWIGDDVKIVNSVTIGDGVIIAAGSIITKSIPPYHIVAGITAKTVRKRFSDDEIAFLIKEKWWNKGEKWLAKNSELMVRIEKYVERVSQK